jgi:wyosine [tRNA(Phe)-imidazoG37] synthetase (radical SAM superfamily)
MTAARAVNNKGFNELHSLPSSGGGVIYGPFENGHYGSTLGVNILGTKAKVCSFNCVYCDLGKTEVRLNRVKNEIGFPKIEDCEQAVNGAFQKIHASGPKVDSVILSGNGEPTLHPDFPEIAKLIVNARDLWLPGRPISLFTNGVALDNRRFAEAANSLDERVVNAPLSRTNLARVINSIQKLKDVTIQSLFFEGTVCNTSMADIDEWLELIAIIKPKAVHIHGLSRPAPTEGLIRCEEDTLYAIASRLERKTSLKAVVIP